MKQSHIPENIKRRLKLEEITFEYERFEDTKTGDTFFEFEKDGRIYAYCQSRRNPHYAELVGFRNIGTQVEMGDRYQR